MINNLDQRRLSRDLYYTRRVGFYQTCVIMSNSDERPHENEDSVKVQPMIGGLNRGMTMSTFEDAFASLKRSQSFLPARYFGKSVKDKELSTFLKIAPMFRRFLDDIAINHSTSLQPKYRGKGLLLEGRFQFWSSKLLIVWDFLQLMGLYWIAANPWPIPYPWVAWTQWWVYFNFDSFSGQPGGATMGQNDNIEIGFWGTRPDYLWYALSFVLTTTILIGVYAAFNYFYFSVYAKRWDKQKPIAATILFYTLYLLYLPTGIAVVRLYYCEKVMNTFDTRYGQFILSADHSQECWDTAHTLSVVFSTLLYLPILLGLPYVFYTHIRDSIMYQHPADHEKRLQAYEIASMLRLDNQYSEGQMWIHASNSLSGAYYRVWMLVLKATLLAIYIFIRGDQSLEEHGLLHKGAQSAWFWLACMIFTSRFAFFNGAHMPFRTSSCNILFYLMCGVLMCNASLGVCNAFGVSNVVTVNSRQTILLVVFTFGSYFLVVLLTLLVALNPYALWPSVRTIHRVEANKLFKKNVTRWVITMNRAIAVRDTIMVTPPEVADVLSLQKAIRDVRSCWLEARSRGSIFEILLGDIEEELLHLYASRQDRMYRQNKEWDTAYLDGVAAGTWRKRENHYILTTPRKRNVLFKLLTLRMLQQREPEAAPDVVALMQNSEMKDILKGVTLLEKSTEGLLHDGAELLQRFAHENMAAMDKNTRKELLFEPTEQEQLHVEAIEEALYKWENIIIAVEEATTEHPFARRIFGTARTEIWYFNREALVTHLAALNNRFGYTYNFEKMEQGEARAEQDLDEEIFGVFAEAAADFNETFFAPV